MPHFSYASFVQEWGLDVDIDGSWIVFRAAAEAQSAIVKSVMTQECTMEDMNNLYEATKMGVSLLGDSCAPKFIGSKIYFFKLIDFFSRLILYLVFHYHNFSFHSEYFVMENLFLYIQIQNHSSWVFYVMISTEI